MVQTWGGEKFILKSWIFLVDHFNGNFNINVRGILLAYNNFIQEHAFE